MEKKTISFKYVAKSKYDLGTKAEAKTEVSIIERRLKLAKAGYIATDKEVIAAFAKWKKVVAR